MANRKRILTRRAVLDIVDLAMGGHSAQEILKSFGFTREVVGVTEACSEQLSKAREMRSRGAGLRTISKLTGLPVRLLEKELPGKDAEPIPDLTQGD